MAFPGGSFAVLNVSGSLTELATKAIVDPIAGQIKAWEGSFLNHERRTLLNFLPALNEQML